ncbi:hypothetical protein [Pedobacter sp. BMA]|uniref:hypothetical protein n=1 Tax=Pedobacter sp. BMA TaxID=1663685 RepID=UPI00064A6527|nr:hypothetical protein [Pedobacter sp. BMA]KLT66572.1 hypothetical protein AB669_05170 [Pedobacter sp. BMA]
MKTNATKLKWRIFGFLMFLLPIGALAQTPNAYLCGTGTVKLTPTFTGYAPVAGDKIIWSINGTAQTPVNYNVPADAVYNIDPGLAPGNYKYSVQVVPADANLCPSTASDDMVIEKLPAPAIAVNAPGSTYCTDQTASTVLTASRTNTTYTLPTGVSMTYAWTATKDGAAVTTITDLGTASTSGDTFTLKAGVAPAAYVFTATGSYATGGVQIVPATTCTATADKTITVTVKPGKATVTITP